jgi:protein-S-isoprenylcysteine O-methyltransferase Ste14
MSSQPPATHVPTGAEVMPRTAASFVFYRRKALVGVTGLATLALLAVESHEWTRDTAAAAWMTTAGWVLAVIGVTIRLWAIMHIGGNKSMKVVTGGPYTLCRNPLYLGSFTAVLGAGLLSGAPVAAAVAVLCLLLVYGVTIRHEERKLEKLFGADYTKYMAEVPRMIPCLSGFRRLARDEQMVINYRDIRRELRTTAGFMSAAAVMTALNVLVIPHLHGANGLLPVCIGF